MLFPIAGVRCCRLSNVKPMIRLGEIFRDSYYFGDQVGSILQVIELG
ncbi:MAG TPA: hypothetical protein VEG37_04835 [Burkholderiales bacterium]|nr:hypothetical protein [Burkholderiales bacterium]